MFARISKFECRFRCLSLGLGCWIWLDACKSACVVALGMDTQCDIKCLTCRERICIIHELELQWNLSDSTRIRAKHAICMSNLDQMTQPSRLCACPNADACKIVHISNIKWPWRAIRGSSLHLLRSNLEHRHSNVRIGNLILEFSRMQTKSLALFLILQILLLPKSQQKQMSFSFVRIELNPNKWD